MGLLDSSAAENMESTSVPKCEDKPEEDIMMDYVRASYKANLSDCAKRSGASSWQDALGMLQDMEAHGVPLDTTAYNAAITACGMHKQWKPATKLIGEMAQKGVTANVSTYSTGINICEKNGQWEEALQLFNEMTARGYKPNSKATYDEVLRVCEKSKNWAKALNILNEMDGGEFPATSKSYAGAIGACSASGQWSQALALLASMKDAELEPRECSLRQTIAACQEAQQWGMAFTLKDDLAALESQTRAPSISSHDDSITELPSVMTATSSLKSEVREVPAAPPGTWEKPAEKPAPPPGTWTDKPARPPGHWVAAEQKEATVVPPLPPPPGNFTKPAQDAEEQQQLPFQLSRPTIKQDPSSLQYSISAYAKGKHWQQALQMLQEAQQEHPGAVPEQTYMDVVGACAQSQQWRIAVELMNTLPSSRTLNGNRHAEYQNEGRSMPRQRQRESFTNDRETHSTRRYKDYPTADKKKSTKTKSFGGYLPTICSAVVAGGLALVCSQSGLIEGDMTELMYWAGIVGLATYAVSARSRS